MDSISYNTDMTELVELWLTNEEHVYNEAIKLALTASDIDQLARKLKTLVIDNKEKSFFSNNNTNWLFSDLLNRAINQVNFLYLAELFFERLEKQF